MKYMKYMKYMKLLFVSLSVCLYPINVKTTELVDPKYFVGPPMTQGLKNLPDKNPIFQNPQKKSINLRISFCCLIEEKMLLD